MATEDAERRVFIETVAGYGMPLEEIALLLKPPVSVEDLRRDYAVELEMGPAKANLETVAMLRSAVKKGNVTAAIYWTKAKMGWVEGKGANKGESPTESGSLTGPFKMPTAKQMGKILHIRPQSSPKSSG
jgi:hypothetical protein